MNPIFQKDHPRFVVDSVKHIKRVKNDSGTIRSVPNNAMLSLMRENMKLGKDLKLFICPELTGNKFRTSGVNNFATKSYDISGVKNDLTQTTAANQPYSLQAGLPGRNYIGNPNNGSCYMTHPTISFGATDAWTVEVVFNWNGSNAQNQSLVTNSASLGTGIWVKLSDANRIQFNGDSGTTSWVAPNHHIIGKNIIVHLSANGSGKILGYVNNVFVGERVVASNISFNQLISSLSDRRYSGKVFHYAIFSKALTASEVATRSSLLRSIFPEIESVQIGTQTWAIRNYDAVCTPQGNLIQEMQAATNTEKITNAADRDFSSDTGFWAKETGVTIADGVCHYVNCVSNISLYKNGLGSPSKWYKIVYTVSNYSLGGIVSKGGGISIGITRNSNGTYTDYVLSTAGNIYFSTVGSTTTLDIDNISVQEVGWSDSQNLYDYIYANTSGTTEQKTYAAVKAAAMWCHYNNDPALGAVYGKLYNWFAVKLLQMDIDYYNAANPTTPWGWRVPTQTDFTTLQTYLGGSSVAGGKLKMTGLNYWNSPNTGATNEVGFSALAGGTRSDIGVFSLINEAVKLSTLTDQGNTYYRNTINFNDITITNGVVSKAYGSSLRLIKN